MKKADLLRRLLKHFETVGAPWPWPDDVKVLPLHTGRHQKAGGAFSWCLARVSDGWSEPMYGSTHSATVIASAREVELFIDRYGDCHLDPVSVRS